MRFFREARNRPEWVTETSGILLLFLLLLYPNSGFKNIVVWVSALSLIVSALRSRRRIHMGGIGPVVFAYATVMLAAALLSIDRTSSMSQWVKLIEIVAGFFVVVNLLSSPPRIQQAARWFFIALGLMALSDLGRLAWTYASDSALMHNGRWFGSLVGYPTIAAGIYAAAILTGAGTLCQTGSDRPLRRAFHAVTLLAVATLLYMLQTRSVLLGMAVGIFAILALAPLPHRKQTAGIAIAALAAVLLIAIPGPFRERIVRLETSGRTELWRDATAIIHTHTADAPYRRWIGFGYGHKIFASLHQAVPDADRQSPELHNHTHNMFIEARIQSGYLGLVAWLGILAVAALKIARGFPDKHNQASRITAAGFTGATVTLLIYGQFSLFFAMTPILLFWTLLAACLACSRQRA